MEKKELPKSREKNLGFDNEEIAKSFPASPPMKIVHIIVDYPPDASYDVYYKQLGLYFIKSCREVGIAAKVYFLSQENYKEIIEKEIGPPEAKPNIFVDCDGDATIGDLGGWMLANYLESKGYEYVGGSSVFVKISYSKTAMKEAFIKNGVPTAKYIKFAPKTIDSAEKMIVEKGMIYPLIIKLDSSYSALGISRDSVVFNFDQLRKKVSKVIEQNSDNEVYAEEFISGPEYTCLLFESHGVITPYRPQIRNFVLAKNEYEAFMTESMESGEDEYGDCANYVKKTYIADPKEELEVKTVSMNAFKSLSGRSFGRVDLRRRAATGELFVLEVNAIPNLEEDSAVDQILKSEGKSLGYLFDLWFNH